MSKYLDTRLSSNNNNINGSVTGNLNVNGTIISPAELSYLNGAISNIQTQLNAKQDTDALLADLINEVVIDDSTSNIHDMMLFNNSGNSNHSSISVIGGDFGGSSIYLAACGGQGNVVNGRKCRISHKVLLNMVAQNYISV